MDFGKILNKPHIESLFASALLAASGVCAERLYNSSDKTTVVFCGTVVSICLFLMKIRFRILYGLVEVAFGLFVLWQSAGEGRGSFNSSFSAAFDTYQISVVLIKTSAAIYILVRGLDNCFHGLPKKLRERIEIMVTNWPL